MQISDRSHISANITVDQAAAAIVGKMYGEHTIEIIPKNMGGQKANSIAIPILFENPEKLTKAQQFEGKATYVPVLIKGLSNPVFIKVADLAKVLNLDAKTIQGKALKEGGVNELIDLRTGGMDASQLVSRHAEIKEELKTIKSKDLPGLVNKVNTASKEYLSTLLTLRAAGKLTNRRIVAMMKDPVFDDKVMQNTIIDIGKNLANHKPEMDIKSERLPKNKDGVKGEKIKYGYTIDKEGNYVIRFKKLGQGTFKKTLKAVDLGTGELSAISTMKGTSAARESKQEVKNLQRLKELNNPNIMPHYAWAFDTKTKGGSSKVILKQKIMDSTLSHELSIHHILNGIAGIAGALAAMHKDKLTHGDLKPDNILFKGDKTNDKQAIKGMLHDFGSLSETGIYSNSGTLGYLSPELERLRKRREEVGNAAEQTRLDYLSQPAITDEDKKIRNELNQKYEKLVVEKNKIETDINAAASDKADSYALGITIYTLISTSSEVNMENEKQKIDNDAFLSDEEKHVKKQEISKKYNVPRLDKDKTDFISPDSDKDNALIMSWKTDAIMKDCTTQPPDKETQMKLDMLEITKSLTAINPKMRISCEEAEKQLKALCQKYGITEQQISKEEITEAADTYHMKHKVSKEEVEANEEAKQLYEELAELEEKVGPDFFQLFSNLGVKYGDMENLKEEISNELDTLIYASTNINYEGLAKKDKADEFKEDLQQKKIHEWGIKNKTIALGTTIEEFTKNFLMDQKKT